MTAGAALIGALIGGDLAGALLGAAIVFCLTYLTGFIQLELRPMYNPDGYLQPLDSGALFHTVSVMLALGLLSAFIGAAVGIALSRVLLSPLYQLLQDIWRMRTRTQEEWIRSKARRPSVIGRISAWLGVVAMSGLLLLASGSGDLFLFSPDIGLHSAVKSTNVGTVVQDEVVSKALHGQHKPFWVYLPPSYNAPHAHTRRYPVLYLLHGSPGSDRDWFVAGKANQAADTLIGLGKIPELIMVLPDGNGRAGETSEWGNSFDQRQLIETYVAIDLVKYVDHKYRTIPDALQRSIGGNSMGGFGAINIALHHPDVFGSVIALGGYYRAEGRVWGGSASYIRRNSPLIVLPTDKQAQRLHFFIGAATKDQPYYSDAVQLVQQLAKLHLSYYFDVQHGFHSWRVWQIQLYNALKWLLK